MTLLCFAGQQGDQEFRFYFTRAAEGAAVTAHLLHTEPLDNKNKNESIFYNGLIVVRVVVDLEPVPETLDEETHSNKLHPDSHLSSGSNQEIV